MSIEEKEVRKIARLARLMLSDEEVRTYQGQLARILEHIDELEKLETGDVPPTAHALGLTNVLREDEPRACTERDAILKNVPVSEGPYIKVPKVIE